jgi:methyl halide transferase
MRSSSRPACAARLHDWLKQGGKLCALFMQVPRPDAVEGFIEYHCDLNAMRALFPATRWEWPKPRYAQVESRSIGRNELAVVLTRTHCTGRGQ